MTAPRVYLAGPMVFYPAPEATFRRMKAIGRRHGLAGVSPFDNQMGLEGIPPDRALLERIVAADIAAYDGHVFDGAGVCSASTRSAAPPKWTPAPRSRSATCAH